MSFLNIHIIAIFKREKRTIAKLNNEENTFENRIIFFLETIR
jgi:hypothetical protein